MAVNTFTLSPTFNKNKVFLLQKSEVEKRLDPYYYLPKFKELENKLKKLPTERISGIASRVFSGSTPLSKGDAYTDISTGIPFVRSGDFNIDGTINFDDLIYIKPEIHETILASSKLKEGDLLFAIVGATIGKVGVYKNSREANINQAICAVRLNLNFDVDYLNAYFQTSVGQSLIDRIKRPVARANVNLDEVASLPVIIPEKETQQKIISIFNNSLLQNKQTEVVAEKLLASIDDYLLKELGITLPIPPDNILKNRIYKTSIKEISGGRFDPKLYSPQTKALLKSLFKTKYKFQTLKSMIVHSTAGDWGLDENERVNENEYVKCLVLRATEFDNKFNLNVEGSRAKYRLVNKIKLTTLNIQTDDLIIEKSGGSIDQPVGRIAILNKDLTNNYTLCFSNFVHKIRVNQNIIYPEFAFNYLKTIHNIKITDVMQSQTNGIRNLILSEYFNLPVALPPLAKQKEITGHITDLRKQAQQLKDKTKEGLKKASEEIEKILLY